MDTFRSRIGPSQCALQTAVTAWRKRETIQRFDQKAVVVPRVIDTPRRSPTLAVCLGRGYWAIDESVIRHPEFAGAFRSTRRSFVLLSLLGWGISPHAVADPTTLPRRRRFKTKLGNDLSLCIAVVYVDSLVLTVKSGIPLA